MTVSNEFLKNIPNNFRIDVLMPRYKKSMGVISPHAKQANSYCEFLCAYNVTPLTVVLPLRPTIPPLSAIASSEMVEE